MPLVADIDRQGRRRSRCRAGIAAGLLVLMAPLAVMAQEDAPAQESEADAVRQRTLEQLHADNPVVARVNEGEIRWREVAAMAEQLPPEYRGRLAEVFPVLLDRRIELRLLGEAARDEDLDEEPEIIAQVRAYEERLIRELYLERFLDEAVTEKLLREGYDALVARTAEEDEVRARHILVESEDEARAIIAELDRGADFVELAEQRSKGPSASAGGDLGYFTRERMVAPFAEAAFALEPGRYSAEPVETQFGWHVIRVEDRRPAEVPGYSELRPELERQLRQRLTRRLLAELREDAEIEVFPADAYPAPAAE